MSNPGLTNPDRQPQPNGQSARDSLPPDATLDFTGSAVGILGWFVLYILGTISVIGLAWVTAGFARWMCRHVRFSDGTQAEFRGTGDQVVIWHILYIFVMVLVQFLSADAVSAGLGVFAAILLGMIVVLTAILHTIIKWFVFNVKLTNPATGTTGPDLTFEGSYGALLGWYLAMAVSVYTIIGWAWVVPAFYRWLASKVKGKGRVFSFHGEPLQFLWRVVAVSVGTMLIVTIPWLYQWLTKWLVQQIRMSYKDEMDLSQLAD